MTDLAPPFDSTPTARPDVSPLLSGRLAILAGEQSLLAGQTILLTGASGGIGETIGRALITAGANAALVDIEARADELRVLAEALSDHSERPLFHRGFDASNPAAFSAFVDDAEHALGPISGLINCAGLWKPAPFADVDDTAWNEAISANLGTAFSSCQAILPRLVARRNGSIVLIASTAGEYGSITPAAHYAAAKGGVIALTKSLAREAGAASVRVNAVSPGPIDTAALISPDETRRAEVENRTLLGRLGEPEEIACACAFLLSPLASFITGHVLGVNGGSLL